MKSIRVISFPDFDKKAEEVDLYFRVKRGQLVSNNGETDIFHKDKVKRHITAEAESYMDSIEDQIQMGLVVEMEDEEGNRQSVNFIEDIENAVYSMIYQ